MKTRFKPRRLLKMCDFLDQLDRKKFDFAHAVYVEDYEPQPAKPKKPKEIQCNLVGCVGGWLPAVFPTIVSFAPSVLRLSVTSSRVGGRALVAKEGGSALDYASATGLVFGIPEKIANQLFAPNRQEVVHSSLRNLAADATPKQVATMLRQFVTLVAEKQIDLNAPDLE